MNLEQIEKALIGLTASHQQLEGRLLSTQAALRALISMQPDPAQAALRVTQQIELLVSDALHAEIPEHLLHGLSDAKHAILPPGPSKQPPSADQG